MSEFMIKPHIHQIRCSLAGQIVSALLISTGFVVLLCSFFEPKWQTNDDIAMSMVAHGYGIAKYASSELFFSNVIWGHLVRAIPSIGGVLGYSTATLAVLTSVGAMLVFSIHRGRGWVAGLSIMTLVLMRPVLFPQFTINAGLLAVAAILSLHLYGQHRSWALIIIGCVFAYFGFLIRPREFLLIFAIGLPLLPWHAILTSKLAGYTVLILVGAIALSAVIDQKTYQTEQWRAFKALNSARTPITDYGADQQLKQRPGLLVQHGYSTNDIDLLRSWFFLDSALADPVRLKAMLSQLREQPKAEWTFDKGWKGVRTLWHPKLLVLALTAILLLVLRPKLSVVLSFGLCVVVAFAIGLTGRTVLRVFVPMASLLVVAPMLTTPLKGWRQWVGNIALVIAAAINTNQVVSESELLRNRAAEVRQALVDFPTDPVVIWGSGFPFEDVYTVLNREQLFQSLQLLPMGVFTLAPFAVNSLDKSVAVSAIEGLVSETGAHFIATETAFDLLANYCSEHLNGSLVELSVQHFGGVKLSRRRCQIIEKDE